MEFRNEFPNAFSYCFEEEFSDYDFVLVFYRISSGIDVLLQFDLTSLSVCPVKFLLKLFHRHFRVGSVCSNQYEVSYYAKFTLNIYLILYFIYLEFMFLSNCMVTIIDYFNAENG